nr:polymorphic toxin type 17 domain-containing protein [Serratia marcescens]
MNTAIYGGSFSEKLTTALLSNVAGQLQAEGAHWLGDRQPLLGDAGKALSHGVLARGDARGAVVGAYGAGLEFCKLTMAGLGLVAGAAGGGKLGVKITTNTLKAAEKAAFKGPLAYVDEPFFNPYGTLSSGQVWSIKGRMKHVQLPNEGKIRFVPPENYSPTSPLRRGPNKGYMDRFDNEWTKGPSRTKGQPFEWDVKLSDKGKAQLGWASRDGKHLNVSLDGKITYK